MAQLAACQGPLVPHRHGRLVTAQPPLAISSRRRNFTVHAATALGGNGDESPGDLSAVFRAELEKRDMAQAAATESDTAHEFDGEALLQVIQDRYDRSYDVTLVKREYMGRTFVAMNIMWAYREQKSFQLTDEEHINRLDYIAAALRQWGCVNHVVKAINARKDRPRVGKAISIMLDLDESVAQEWFA